MAGSRIVILRYKNILDQSIRNFFTIYGDSFGRNQAGKYVLALTSNKKQFYDVVSELVFREIRANITDFDFHSPTYYLLVGDCKPADNLLLSVKPADFSAKLSGFILKYGFKYILKERDIDIDESELNRIFNDVFDSMFLVSSYPKALAGFERNLFPIRHSRIDSDAISRLVNLTYGEVNCVNKKLDLPPCLISINDMIFDAIPDKSPLNSNQEFRLATAQVKTFIKQKIGF